MTHCRFYQAMNNRPSQCFLFKTCGRKVENATFDCVLNQENTLEVEAFVDSATTCETICQKVFFFIFLQEAFELLISPFISCCRIGNVATISTTRWRTKKGENSVICSAVAPNG